jgi:enoyl-CoA hydratase/carnithine racemase
MDPFLLDVANGVATVTLNRPERLNALLWESYAGLRDFFGAIKKDRSIRAIVLTGAGRGFCSGGDVREVIGPLIEMSPRKVVEFVRMTCAVVANIRKAPQPVIAALNGIAFGGGAVIALACDIRLAAPEAKIAFSFRGLSGADMGACWLLPRVVGLARAGDWLLTGRPVGAKEALAAGLLSRIVPANRLGGEARSLALTLSRVPRRALAITKEMIDREFSMTFEKALEAEAKIQAALMGGKDFRESYRAFVEKREPRFD